MAQTTKPSTKRILIDKANTTIMYVLAVSAFIVVFSLIASKSLISRASYQNRVISAQKKSLSQVQADLSATSNLTASYQAFINQPQNLLGGNPVTNTNGNDGNNAKLILDALPSSYDFPALTTSLEKMLSTQGVSINNITGTDEELLQQTNPASSSPQPVPIPFSISVIGNYTAIQNVVHQFESSIRPFQFLTEQITGDQSNLTLTITAQTFYQPAKNLSITPETIR